VSSAFYVCASNYVLEGCGKRGESLSFFGSCVEPLRAPRDPDVGTNPPTKGLGGRGMGDVSHRKGLGTRELDGVSHILRYKAKDANLTKAWSNF